ncbi:hypothetical protein GCM10022254_46020 [Actinomadura meridiana]|uniref:Coenzyme Q-binding protein COQ10 START domain-containing protein n=1 Tax=Actinomadura meridiana TaxID=559626 RepID=A0ABP8CA60_9ACTN
MKRGTRIGPVPIAGITERLPGGRSRRSLGLGGVTKKLPGGGRTAGAAGGVLLASGAAVAASRVLAGRRDGGRDSSDEDQDAPEEGSEKLLGRLKNSGANGTKVKITNIVEHIDVGAPRRLVYDQWTRFQDYPSFMKKVVSVEQASDEKVNWKAKIFWSNRTWESTIVEQVPDRHIVWRSQGPKGHVDGTVSFHKLSGNLTRVLLVVEYHPRGLAERAGNLWRAQGRRVRLELKHFHRYVMTQSLTRPDEIEGWRGEIHGSEVVRTHKEALKDEEREEQEYEEAR